MSCIFIINYAEALKLLQDHIVYISFYTANAQLTANLIRLTEICLNYTFIYHTRETNATRSAETFSSEHLNGRVMCCNPSHITKQKENILQSHVTKKRTAVKYKERVKGIIYNTK